MKIEAGKFYKNANGDKVGPMRFDWTEYDGANIDYAGSECLFLECGKSLKGRDPDLISEWVEQNNGPDTLGNLDLKLGDVVRLEDEENTMTIQEKEGRLHAKYKHINGGQFVDASCMKVWTVVSRASDKPRTFGELSDQEKGALLLAHHEGKRIEYMNGNKWIKCFDVFSDFYPYRVAPTRITGTVEVDPQGNPDFDTWEVV